MYITVSMIGRDMQAEMLEVVAGIGDDDQIVAAAAIAAQAERELGAADAAGQCDASRSRAHRNRSSSGGRIRLAAVDAGADQRKPRTRTTGGASSAWPITSEAAAATSSAKPTTLTSQRAAEQVGPAAQIDQAPAGPATPIATPTVPWRQAGRSCR